MPRYVTIIVLSLLMASCSSESNELVHINGNTIEVLSMGGGKVNDQYSSLMKLRCTSKEEDTTYWVSAKEQKQVFRLCWGWYVGDSVRIVELSDPLRKEFTSHLGFVPTMIKLEKAVILEDMDRLFHPLIPVQETERILDYLVDQDLELEFIDAEGAWPILSTSQGDSIRREQVLARISARLLDGKQIMGQEQDAMPLELDLSSPDQLTDGLRYALKVLPSGRHTVLVPSFLAFGPQGSVTGIVGPQEPIVYEINILD